MCFWKLHQISQQEDKKLSRKTKEDKKNFIFERKSFTWECFYGQKERSFDEPVRKIAKKEAEVFSLNVRKRKKKILQKYDLPQNNHLDS